ncbi:hypothetical protein KHP57_21720, partial [Algiphilus sp. NNCM1]|nr:hypothetical protein [Algiphilus acroporae]
MTADESGFMPVLHMPDATYYVSDSAESDKRETQNALRMSDSPETDIQRAKTCVYLSDSPESDTMGVRNGVPDDAQPAAAPSTSASVATQSAARKPETANSLFAPLAPDEMAAYVAIDKWLHTWRLT